jgi:hypothetical protein
MNLTKKDKLDMHYVIKNDNVTNYKEVNESSRTVDLIANTYYYFDSDFDVLIPGVAAKSIQDRGVNSKSPGKIKHAMHHDLKEIVALPTLLEEEKFQGKDVLRANSFFPEVEDSDKELQKYLAGLYDQHSIGFQYLQLEYIEKGGEGWDDILRKLINPEDADNVGFLYLVKEIALYEYSTVAFGANRLTPYIGSKSTSKKVQYDSFIKKLNALHEAMKNGVKDKFTLELQEKQIKQMIWEMFNPEPDLKTTYKKPESKSTQVTEIISNHKFI